MIWKKPHSCPVVYVKGKRKYLYRFILIKPFWIKPRCPGGVPMAAVSFTAENKKRTNDKRVKKHTFLPQYQHLCHKCKLPFLPPPLLSTDSLAIVFYFHLLNAERSHKNWTGVINGKPCLPPTNKINKRFLLTYSSI